jgi:hypothetical protein
MKNLLIVEIDKGMLQGVYTPSLEDFEVRLKDSDCREDNEQEFLSLQALIEKGAVRDIYCDPVVLDPIDKLPTPDPVVCLLIAQHNRAKSELGFAKQNIFAAFIDGYMTSVAALGRYLFTLKKSDSAEVRTQAKALADGLKEFRQKQHDNFDRLCDYLNSPEEFDAPDEAADK